jgi:biopolymer transport protein TolR
MRGKRRLSTLSEINVTNLVDVTLVLLIIFILVAPFIRSGIQVKAPEVASSKPLTNETSIMVQIDKDSNIFLDRKQVVLEDIGPSVAKARQAMPDSPVLIEGDGEVPYEIVMKVMDQIRQAGISDLNLVTRKGSKENQDN